MGDGTGLNDGRTQTLGEAAAAAAFPCGLFGSSLKSRFSFDKK